MSHSDHAFLHGWEKLHHVIQITNQYFYFIRLVRFPFLAILLKNMEALQLVLQLHMSDLGKILYMSDPSFCGIVGD